MPDPAGTFNDGGLAFGSQSASVTPPGGGSGVAFIFEKISLKRPTKQTIRRNQVGVPNGQFFTVDVMKTTATIQLPTATTAAPALFSSVPLVPIGGGTAIVFLISEVGEEFEHEGEQKVSVTLSQKLSGASQPTGGDD